MSSSLGCAVLGLVVGWIGSAHAEWEGPCSQSDMPSGGKMQTYFDFDRARREDGHLIIWELGNVLPPQKWLHASATGRQSHEKSFKCRWK
jgi:hypothetical protein